MSARCDHCGRKHNRKRFCSNKCKDRWHNTANPARQLQNRFPNQLGEQPEPMADNDLAMMDATAGWDEGGWLSDDSGVSAI